MNRLFLLTFAVWVMGFSGCASRSPIPEQVTMTRSELMDKIKGGWAGQALGCTYGGPTEFKFRGTMIQDYVPIGWGDGRMKNLFVNAPGLYDDLYMDLTFVEVFERLGLDAPVDSLAWAFATAEYVLWHANQAARYNILHGIRPPQSGHWLNNPHADDLDYQIEADYAGLMSPGMPNAASEISDRVGHIMTYGDGWYGGVYVGAMYSLAFVLDDVEQVVTEALKTIPPQSRFYQCIRDVIRWHEEYPDDWKQTWFECERKYSEDIGCPDGALVPYNIDAVINSAYIVIGLLYGEGDFFKTIDISTRCGQDSDCNPASAAGILGTMIGYSAIPEMWMRELREVEDIRLAYTQVSLNDAYRLSFEHALEVIGAHGGDSQGDPVVIRCQHPEAVRYEKSFEGMYPVLRRNVNRFVAPRTTIDFEGTGFALRGSVKAADEDYEALVEVSIDGGAPRTVGLPVSMARRSQEICWQYQLPNGKHTITLEWVNPVERGEVHCGELIVYSDKPARKANEI